jgi:DNA-binding transcriptional ArsR family regulator
MSVEVWWRHHGFMRDLATIGKALGSTARAAMIVALFDGAEHTAGELAAAARVAPATASSHLSVLVDAGLVCVRDDGRFRRYRLASSDIAHALEQLGGPDLGTPTSLRLSREQRRLRAARTCYDHLAGQLGVAVADLLIARGWVDPSVSAVSDAGASALGDALDLDLAPLRAARRQLVRPCLDWTERRQHVAGALGAAIATAALKREWVRRQRGSRGLTITPAGCDGFGDLGVALPGEGTP